MNKPHKHAALIKLWAEGAEIEALFDVVKGVEEWRKCSPSPSWSEHTKYRVAKKPDVTLFHNIYPRGPSHVGHKTLAAASRSASFYHGQLGVVSITYDGETGKPKAAEVVCTS